VYKAGKIALISENNVKLVGNVYKEGLYVKKIGILLINY